MFKYVLSYAKRYGIRKVVKKIFKYIFICSIVFFINNNVNAKSLTSISVDADSTYNNSYMYQNNSTTKFIGYLGSRINTNSHVLLFSFYNTNTIKANTTFTLTVRGNDDFFPTSVNNATKGVCYSLTKRSTFDCGGGVGWSAYVSGFSVSNNSQYGFDLTFTSREEAKFIVIRLSVPTGQLLTGYDYFTINSATLTFNENQELSAIEEKLTTIESKQNQILSKQQEIQDKADDINNNITSDDIDTDTNTNAILNYNYEELGVITQLLTLPLHFMQSILTNINSGVCSAVTLPLPFVDDDIVLPCFSDLFGSTFNTLFNLIGLIGSAFILYKYFIKLYHDIENMTELRNVEVVEE